ncbi:MAG: type II secretion system protein N [Marinibacterium sp.]
MTGWTGLALRTAIVLLAAASIAPAGLGVARHAAGIVALPASTPAENPVQTRRAPPDLSAILERAPFGRAPVAEGSQPAADTTLPRMILRGVFATGGPASAALVDVDGTGELFRLEETVVPDLVLTRVETDHVVLTGAARSVTLRFETDAEESPEAEPDNREPDNGTDLIARLGGAVVVPARYQKPKAPETTSDYITYWRQRIRKNPQAVLDEIGLRATDKGYVVAENHDVGVRLAGLRSGDLVRSVNGQTVGDPDRDRRFYDRIAASGQARLEVERNGRVLTFSFPLR